MQYQIVGGDGPVGGPGAVSGVWGIWGSRRSRGIVKWLGDIGQ